MSTTIVNPHEAAVLYDHEGRPIPAGPLKEKAAQMLPDFIEKNKEAFNQWFLQKGATARPPIRFLIDEERWVWLD